MTKTPPNAPMHIILFTSSKTKSGGSRQALYLAQGLAERGHNVTFFVPDNSTLRTLAPDWKHWGTLGEKRMWRKNIEAAMPPPGTPCIVHGFHNKAVKLLAWWGLFWRKRAAIFAHRGVIFRPNNPLPYWSPGISAFLVNSKACAQILRSLGVNGQRLAVVANSVPDARITPRTPRLQIRATLGFQEETRVFGTVAGESPVKGVDILLESFASVFKKSAPTATPRLLVLGVSRENWQARCLELGIAEAVQLIPHTEDVASHLNAMDIFILPSRSESMPNTLLEAIRMGLPAIGTHVGAVPEILESCGITVPPENPQALATAMEYLLQHPEETHIFAKNALLQGNSYAPDVRLNTVENIYRQFLRKLMP